MSGDKGVAQLSLTDIHKSFGDTKVIHGVDLEIADGEFTVFVGPSGCGKSTLLRMIAGLETVTSGAVAIGGADVTDAEPSERGVTMVFQSYALYPHMSVIDAQIDGDVRVGRVKIGDDLFESGLGAGVKIIKDDDQLACERAAGHQGSSRSEACKDFLHFVLPQNGKNLRLVWRSGLLSAQP